MSSPWRKSLLFTLVLFSNLLLFTPNVQAQCSTFFVRQEWRQLSNPQRTTYVNAVASLYQNERSVYIQFANDHNNLGSSGIHGNGMFLPWHRYFLIEYERALRRRRAGVSVPYWDATLDNNSNFASSPVFSTTTGFGRFTRSCITFPGLRQALTDSDGSCLNRGGQWNPFQSTAQVNSIISNSQNYNTFSRALEVGIHNQVHVVVGGDMASFRSPLDPLFFLHHCNIDRIWAQWQSVNFNTRLTQYGWTAPLSGFGTRFESLTSFLPNYNVRVNQVMDISTLCYRYANIPVRPGTPSTGTQIPSLVRRTYGDEKPAPKATAATGYGPPPPVKEPEDKPAYAAKEPMLTAIVDIGEIYAVPEPLPLPESWIRMNLLNVTYVRECEKNNAEVVKGLNKLRGYLPPRALINDIDGIQKQIEQVKGRLSKVFFSVHGKQYEVDFEKDCPTTTKKIVDAVKKTGYLDAPKPTVRELAAIIGDPAFSADTAGNPFTQCKPAEKGGGNTGYSGY